MYTKLDPNDPASLSDYEASHLTVRPTKAQVVELLDDLRAGQSRTAEADRQRRNTERELGALQERLHTAEAIDPEARLLGDLQAAVEAYEQRLREAAERRDRNRGGYATMSTGYIGTSQPERPALDTPLGRALLHLAARHSVPIEATVVYPDPTPNPSLAVVPAHLAPAVRDLVESGHFQ